MIIDGKYIGEELQLFENAKNWKSYFSKFLRPYLKGSVLEVGAGIGGSTMILCDGSQKKWVCLEPDIELAKRIEQRKINGEIPSICNVTSSYLSDMTKVEMFDAILYLDVIEHIENDSRELEFAAQHLKPGGVIVVLVPAHQFLYTAFDKKIGHFRRYSKKRLQAAVPNSLLKKELKHLDSVGFLASAANRFFLKSEMPTASQIKFWDTYMVPFSKWIDRCTFYLTGKTILGIWQKA